MEQYTRKSFKCACVIIYILVLSFNAYSQKLEKSYNYYVFGDSVNKSIIEGVTLYKKQLEGYDTVLKKMFLLLTKSENNTKVIISYCGSCSFINILRSSDRYFKYKGNQIPVIFDFDLEHSIFLKSEGDSPIGFTIGGYIVEFDKNNRIVRVGQEQ
jgi:hypothetical protein